MARAWPSFSNWRARSPAGRPGTTSSSLVTDGEETGLRGARAFAEHHPLIARVGVVVNFEARGASGPTMMFETGPGNARLMDLMPRSVARPSANSVTYEVYRLLPNDTDFTVYRKLGLTGFNFAFSNSASLYHSARDNLQNIDPRSLQHMGDQGFAMVSVLADTDLASLKSESNASFFDIFGLVTVVWPAAINVPVALLALLGLRSGGCAPGRLPLARDTRRSLLSSPCLRCSLPLDGCFPYPLGIWPGVHPLDHPQPWPRPCRVGDRRNARSLLVAGIAGYARRPARASAGQLDCARNAHASVSRVTSAARPIRSFGRHSASPSPDGSRPLSGNDQRVRCA